MKPGSLSYRIVAFLLCHIFFRIRVEGAEREPLTGPVILCANHISDADPVFISAVLPRQARFMAKKELFSIPLLRSVIRFFGAFPVDRGHADVAAIRHSLALLKEMEVVGIFPQGTRCKGISPKKGEAKSGVGMLAFRSHAPILPVCIQTKNYKIRPFCKIVIRVGEPIPAEVYAPSQATASEYKRIADLAFSEIGKLVTE